MTTSPLTPGAPRKSYRTVVLLLLTLVYVFNFVDRQIIGNISPAIKADLGFTDAQLGWLKGFAFALFYSVVGIPLAWLADRYSRVRIVTIALAAWSAMTALTGMASNFTQMFLARLGVGIGEAGGSPPSHSMISDLYAKEERASALGVYSLGIPLGIAFSYILAGALVERFGWRGTLLVLGGLGVALALVLAIVIREPKRGGIDGASAEAVKAVGIMESIGTLTRIRSWWAMCLGIAFASFCGYALGAWGIDYVTRLDPSFMPGSGTGNFSTLMFSLGLINLVFYSLGTFGGAVLTEKLANRDIRAYGWMPALGLLLAGPALIAALYVPTVTLHVALLCLYLVGAGVYLGPSFAAAQTLAPVNMRAMSTALFFLILNLIALGGGPTYVGIVSSMLADANGELVSLRIALTTLAVPFALSIGSFLLAAKWLPEDWAEAERRNTQPELVEG